VSFTPETKNPGDIIRSADWNTAMTAVAALFAKLDASTGHHHTGALEDGPPIGAAGLADNAVTPNKIAAGAVTATKIADGSVTAAKIADGSATAAKLADGSVTTAKIAGGAVSTDKIANAAITAAKLAAGVVPDIGIAVTMGLTNGATVPIPSGFSRADCIYMVALKFIDLQVSNQSANCVVNAAGVVTATPANAIAVTAVAFARRGGW
jgi:hypothetical protein